MVDSIPMAIVPICVVLFNGVLRSVSFSFKQRYLQMSSSSYCYTSTEVHASDLFSYVQHSSVIDIQY